MKFLVSYAQTTWRYGVFRLNRIIGGRSPRVQKMLLGNMSDVFAGDPGGEIGLYRRGDAFGQIEQLGSLPCVKPFGMDHVAGEGLYYLTGKICSADGIPGDEHVARLNADGEIDLEIRSPLFNLPRTVRRTRDGLLIASSGIDAIVEIDLAGNMLWSWWGTDHGFDRLKSGEQRKVQKGLDHRARCYPSHAQTTHMNSAMIDPHDPSKVLAVLFYQGSIIRIDRESLEHEVVASGLNGPHHVRGTADGYLVSNTRAGVVQTYDREFRPLAEVTGSNRKVPKLFRWTQDALPTPYGTTLIADGNRFRLLEVDTSGREAAYGFGMPKRVFQLQPVPDDFTL